MPTKNCLLVHVQGLCYYATRFSSKVVQTGIPELDIGFMREPALIDEQGVDLVLLAGACHNRQWHVAQ
jgi:hypothetical protein